MEFHEKLQELRKQKNLTQEELGEALYVSRTAISKWESGRGYPNIDSLKAISQYFSVSIDELLSSGEAITLAEVDSQKREKRLRSVVYGLLDCSLAGFLFLPFFGQETNGVIQAVSLLALTEIEWYIKIPYLVVVFGIVLWGILTLALQSWEQPVWLRIKDRGSLGLSAVAAFLFIFSRQPYAAAFTFLFLIIKALMLIKWA